MSAESNSEQTLESCPFCGRQGMIEEFFIDHDPQPWYVATCEVCPVKTYDQTTPEEAARIWNTRASANVVAPTVPEDRTRCASCKHEFCKECNELDECCKCDTDIPPRTVAERLAQHEHVEVVEGVLGGVNPLVSRRRISVHHILSYLYNGESINDIAKNYQLAPEAIQDAIAFAQDVYDDAIDSALRRPAAAPLAAGQDEVARLVADAYEDAACIAESCTQDDAARDEPFRIAQTIREHARRRTAPAPTTEEGAE